MKSLLSPRILVRASSRMTINGLRSFSSLPTSYNPYQPKENQAKLLFTPGPLTVSHATKEAMLADLGSRDDAFIQIIKDIRSGLLDVAGVSDQEFTTIPVQGSGTFGVEAVLSSTVDRKANKELLIIANGSYGLRMTNMAKANDVKYQLLEYFEDEEPSLEDIDKALIENSNISHVAVVHSETTSGIINDVETIGQLVNKHGRSFVVDAMSSFGAVPLDLNKGHIDYLVSSANKCLEGVPGFAYVIARKTALDETEGRAASLSMDIHGQCRGLDKNGQFRFTPPTHSILAFRQALAEYKQEGGLKGRLARYEENQQICHEGMLKLGFQLYLPRDIAGPIITSFRYPDEKNWDFETFYTKLSDRGFVIYPGKVSKADCFRIGHIGRLFPSDTTNLVSAVEEVCREMKILGLE